MKKRTVGLTWLTALAGLLALSSCDSTTSSGMGTVRLQLVASGSPSFASAAEQADFGDITSATVTISHVELMPGHVAIDLGAPSVSLNLLDMEGDVTRLLGSAPALGGYEQLRLIVSDVTVTLADGSVLPARVPSGPQTGIKVDFAGPVTVGPGATVDLLVVFDVEESFVFQGPPSAPRSVHFQPVVHATTMEAASIGGQVTVNRPAGSPAATVAVTVTASVSGSVTATVTVDVALADAATTGTGNYLVRYLQPGLTYTMAASAAGYPTVSPPSGDAARDIAAVAGSNTGPNFTLAP